MKNIKKQDKQIYQVIQNEVQRQQEGIELIPSENIASPAVIEALGTPLTNKYSEGYPGARYYGGQEYIDVIETLAIERAKKLFGVPYANVQPYSGSLANLAVYVAICEPGDTIMGQGLLDGGHLTHGWKASATSMFYNAIQYHVKENGRLDFEEIEALAKKHKPRLIWVGATAYVREFPFQKFAKIADEIGAYLVADIAHVAGLIVAGVHKSPVPYAHIITLTTHKTLRGPRGGMILVTEKGLKKDPELGKKINRAIFPNLQGGPHDHQTAAIAVALGEALKPSFKTYGKQIIINAKTLAEELMNKGAKLVSKGTDNHMMLIDCGIGRGVLLEIALDMAGITLNKNTIPREQASPFYPSGVRLGTPSVTTRGMKAPQMRQIARWIIEVMKEIEKHELPENKTERSKYLQEFKTIMKKNKELTRIKQEVKTLCKKFPAYK
ncbi:serine hydroxymethyltransferase [Patescibacteria group bacterium]|nr:serine hydroxymethyltransferase [Patescibacteria group bacterium]MBU2416837.1 serine hydroxymethyltransferase [Patescibacteria group bacterium]